MPNICRKYYGRRIIRYAIHFYFPSINKVLKIGHRSLCPGNNICSAGLVDSGLIHLFKHFSPKNLLKSPVWRLHLPQTSVCLAPALFLSLLEAASPNVSHHMMQSYPDIIIIIMIIIMYFLPLCSKTRLRSLGYNTSSIFPNVTSPKKKKIGSWMGSLWHR